MSLKPPIDYNIKILQNFNTLVFAYDKSNTNPQIFGMKTVGFNDFNRFWKYPILDPFSFGENVFEVPS